MIFRILFEDRVSGNPRGYVISDLAGTELTDPYLNRRSLPLNRDTSRFVLLPPPFFPFTFERVPGWWLCMFQLQEN